MLGPKPTLRPPNDGWRTGSEDIGKRMKKSEKEATASSTISLMYISAFSMSSGSLWWPMFAGYHVGNGHCWREIHD